MRSARSTSSIWGGGGGSVSQDAVKRTGLDPMSPRMRLIIALAHEIQGFPRHLSQHVGGFVITRSRLDEVVPIGNGAMDERTFVEWDKDDLDALGILKVDVLGLGMLTCIRKALRSGGEALSGVASHALPLVGRVDRRRRSGVGVRRLQLAPSPNPPPQGGREHAAHGEQTKLTLATIPAEDPAVYRMLSRADSLGVFQVESRAQMSMLPRLKPTKFYDLVIEVAIVRPGPIQGDMVHPYLRRKQGLEPVSYPSKELEAVLSKTLGVPLFQEQAMKIAIVAGGFTPGEADKLRRAMATFKRTGTIGTFRDKMINGMLANGYARDFAERCFGQIEGFGEYGFPESHAASFALLVYASSLAEMPLPGRLRGGAAQRPADGLLRAGADRARCARARRRGAAAGRELLRLGFDAGAGTASRRAPACSASRDGGRHPRDARGPPRPARDQGLVGGRCEADRGAARFSPPREAWWGGVGGGGQDLDIEVSPPTPAASPPTLPTARKGSRGEGNCPTTPCAICGCAPVSRRA